MTGDEAWAALTAAWARDKAAHAVHVRECRSRRRPAAEVEVGDVFAQAPDLVFDFPGETPPRHTLQASRGVQVTRNGRVRFFTKKAARAEAEVAVWKFKAALPLDWEPRAGAVKLECLLVYPARRTDRLSGDAMVFHTTTPDADNIIKSAVLDAMTRAGVWRSDAQVCDLTVRKRRSALPRWEVKVWFARAAQGRFAL